jgi:type IV pilus assembly protein PilY1
MTRHIIHLLKSKFICNICFFGALLFATDASAALINLATSPLQNSSTSVVLPNLMYVLDNSGSMASDYLPDYINDSNKCKSTGVAGSFTASCTYGDPAYNLKDFNGLAYNPEINYLPGLNADGTSMPSMTSSQTTGWTNVPTDAYGIQNRDQLNRSASSISLIPDGLNNFGYPDRVWCSSSSATVADLSNSAICNQNDQYVFPTNTYSNAYSKFVDPFYYKFTPIEYCTDKKLTSCQASQDATHKIPAILRWCDSAAHALYTNTINTGCQAKYTDSTYFYAKWSGVNTDTANGKIQIKADASTTSLSISNITIGGVRVIPTIPSPALSITDTTNASQRNTLAANIASNINSAGVNVSGSTFAASSTGDLVSINPSSSSITASIVVTATSSTFTTTKAVGKFQITAISSAFSNISSLKVGGVEILGSTIIAGGTNGTARRAMANSIVNLINSQTSSPDYSAVSDGASMPTVTITAVVGGSGGNGSLTNSSSGISSSSTNLTGGGSSTVTGTGNIVIASFSGGVPIVSTFSRVNIVPTTTSYPKAASRIDCAGATCTYDEEMTNFANWYAYYRTRMQMMKSSTTLAFRDIDTRYRVGFYTINNPSTNYLPIATFDDTQRANWYAQLISINPGNSTPLRSALTTVGRIFAGKHPLGVTTDDPMQYSCQQNFTLLTTDGYWNSDSASAVKNVTNTGTVGDMDGGSTERPLYEGPTASSETLADAAKYYYDTDLRDASLSNCTGSAGVDVCQNNVFTSSTDNNVQQHMTTFTLGLGVDGTLNYDPDYKNQSTGDFVDLTNGTINWPVPAADQQTAVDDLWHAAVNGRGTYFSAKNPTQLADSLSNALTQIASKIGAGAAAATSTLNPVTGNNSAFVASYATVKWSGNVESRSIDTTTGVVSPDANWCIEDVFATPCTSTVTVDNSVTPAVTYCAKSVASAANCPSTVGKFVSATSTCNVPIATSCHGTLTQNPSGVPVVISATTDDRNILMNVGSTLGQFNYTNIVATGNSANFQPSFLAANLSQWTSLTSAQQSLMTPDKVVNFLRGQFGYEDRLANNTSTDNRLFRYREAVLGDAIESTPAYNGIPKAQYTDPGYGSATVPGTFAYQQAGRDGTVYVGTNDGMLHAFDEDNGFERWAYVPSMVIPNMWRLADQNYASLHTNYVNGDPIINDICTANCSTASPTWKTILVGGLNGGGKGYYALDITNPNIDPLVPGSGPKLLWEFDTSRDSDLGYSFGNPIITKKSDGTWVVLITSGYNNVGGSNKGQGFLYVLNANTGAVITKYGTGVGNATTPSGLAKISAFVTDSLRNNLALNIYGGDLLGNLWRFDINAAQSSTNPFLVATLTGPKRVDPTINNTLVPQPITVKPELSESNGDRIIFIGTGKYLEPDDLPDPAVRDTGRQTLYAIKDNSTTTLNNPRSSSTMVQQVITDSGATRTVTNNTVLPTNRGWYIDLPDTGERQNVPAQLVFGTLLVPTIVPSNTVCSPGGFGWLNFLNFQTGAVIATSIVGTKTNAPIVGLNVLYVGGNPKVEVVTSDNPTPQLPAVQPPFTGGSVSGFQQHRVIWRELLDQQQ